MNKCVHFVQVQTSHACALCGARSVGEVLCPSCHADLPRLPAAHCPCCAIPAAAVCAHCQRHPPAFKQTSAAFLYAYPLDGLIQQFKYGKALHLAPFFANALTPCIKDSTATALIPMPLHPKRLAERGFNQAVEIARPLARQRGIPLLIDAAQRTRHTPSQAGLTHADRLTNLEDAFTCDARVAGHHIALLDDVMTTGASLNTLAKAVIAAGAVSVEAWVVARTPALTTGPTRLNT
ncbi:MAG: ComF family protein [Betaproteobacteria bacterium]|nr:MAG: ComF family protein [Betaproteobacteria bacterium]